MGRDVEQVTAGGERAVGAGGDVKAAATGDHSSATYTHIEHQYVQQVWPDPDSVELSPEEWEKALRRYATRVGQCYGRLDLEVLIPTEEGDHPAVGLAEVFVPPLVRADPPPVELPRDVLDRLVAEGEWPSDLLPGPDRVASQQARRAYLERPLRGVLDVLADPAADRLVLLGDPGAGKSTLTRHVALEPPTGRVPLVVELREYAAGEWRERTFEDFLEHLHTAKGMAPPRAVVKGLLASGRTVVFFDGLDELFDPAVREQVSHRIADFAGRYGGAGVRVVVTSRVIGYKRGVLEGAGFAHFMIHDLNEEQIGTFALRWYETAFPHDEEKAGRLCRRLTDAVSRSRPVRELAGNPLLLTILAIIGRRRELPRDRIGVYRHAVAVLVAHWDEHAKYLKGEQDTDFLDEVDRRDLLRLVARQMQDGEGGIAGNHIHRDDLLTVFREYLREHYELPPKEAVVVARRMVERFRERNFILSHYGGGVYGFVHRAFLEYLAAEDIERRYTREREWTRDELIEELFVRRAEDPAWHEVLLLLVGRLEDRDAAAVVDRLLGLHRRRDEPESWRLLVLAVRALSEVRRIGRLAPQSRAVADALIALLETVDRETKVAAELDALLPALSSFPSHWTGGGRILRWFHLRGQFERYAHKAAVAVACRLYQERDTPRVLALHAPSAHVRREALRLLARRWGCFPEVRELLRDRAVKDPAAGLAPLGEYTPDDPWVRGLFWDYSLHHENPGIRRWTLELLSRYSREEDVRHLLRARAVDDTDEWVRCGALDELARWWGHDVATWALVEERAVADPGPTVRMQATSIAGWHLAREAGVHELLYGVYLDAGMFVRLRALGFLGAETQDHAARRRLARDCAVGEADARVRGFAMRLLARDSADAEDTWVLVQDRAVADPDQRVREEANRMLAENRRQDTADRESSRADTEEPLRTLRTLTDGQGPSADELCLLRERVTSDADTWVRVGALHSLTTRARDDQGTWELVRALLTADPNATVRHYALRLWVGHGLSEGEAGQVLARRVSEDPDPGMRFSALRWWAVHDSGEAPATAARQRGATDPEAQVRRAALWLLAFGWPARPETAPYLRERAESETHQEVRDAAADALAAAEALAPIVGQLP
jgi:hypothetical protein